MEQYAIPNVVKATDVLRLISQHPQGLNAVAIEKQTRVPRTTVFRILRTLLSVGWVRKDNDRYYAGPGLVEIGLHAINKLEIRQLAAPILQELTAETEFTSHLAIPSSTQSMIVEVCDSPHPLRVASRPGSRVGMHCSSTGKIFLSYLYADQLATHLGTKALPARTDNTLVDFPNLQAMTEQVLHDGYAVDDREYDENIRCVAAPVFNLNQQVIAALGVTSSLKRFAKNRIPTLARAPPKNSQRTWAPAHPRWRTLP